MSKYLTDFAPGPLDRYRNAASFDWKAMKLFLETQETIEFQREILDEFKSNPLFQPTRKRPTLDEERRNALKATHLFKDSKTLEPVRNAEMRHLTLATAELLLHLAPEGFMKYGLSYGMPVSTMLTMGTERHGETIRKALNGEIFMCYCLTEIGHGSNTRGMKTTATYDQKTKQFVLNSENFEAAKAWQGNLGKTATHAIVFAQLITDGIKRGLHAFVVQIRDPDTLLPCKGLTVGDMGEKIGLNGMDNGYLIFHNYRIPREALLNKNGDVLEDGTYVSPFKDPNKRHGASFGALSHGRVAITFNSSCYLSKAITIALRYAAVRKQFGPDDEEMPILEYQSHQHRLIPYLAALYVLKTAATYMMQTQFKFNSDLLLGRNKDELQELGMELHAISSASKPVATWTVRDGIQESREACAGHGYLKVAGIGEVRNFHDAMLTYEGEGHVLIQQTSNWLLKYWPLVVKGKKFSTPLQSIDFLNDAGKILRYKFTARNIGEMCSVQSVFGTFQWLTCYLLKRTYEKLENLNKTMDSFTAKNETQLFFAKSLSIVYIQHFFLKKFYDKVNEAKDPAIKKVLLKLFSLYGLFTLEKHTVFLYQGNYTEGPAFSALIQEAILALCRELKDDSIALVDAIAVPDFVLNSVLGASDGLVYKHLEGVMVTEAATKRPEWWKEIIYAKQIATSKL